MPAPYPFDQRLAITAEGDIARHAQGQAYTLADTTFATPVPVTDLAGVPLLSLTSNDRGLLPEFYGPEKLLVWKSGPHTALLVSWKGIAEDAARSADTAQQALADLQAYISTNGGDGSSFDGTISVYQISDRTPLSELLMLAATPERVRELAQAGTSSVTVRDATGAAVLAGAATPDGTTVNLTGEQLGIQGRKGFASGIDLPDNDLPTSKVSGLVQTLDGVSTSIAGLDTEMDTKRSLAVVSYFPIFYSATTGAWSAASLEDARAQGMGPNDKCDCIDDPAGPIGAMPAWVPVRSRYFGS